MGFMLHSAVVTQGKGVFHTIRATDGPWQPFGDVYVEAGGLKTPVDVACASSVPGDLHVCCTDGDGALWHTIRYYVTGEWQPWGNVKNQAGDPTRLIHVACSAVAGDLHVCALGNDSKLWHTIRTPDGAWQAFASPQVALPEQRSALDVACSGIAWPAVGGCGGDLHVCVVATDGTLWHTARLA
jgi:hypothetical protein